ncbi:hypothetical protein BDZ45DRAFT_803907 [Acephala macrosclerotiorum]|nr:hypothetical protein BDZ45DRAFT_803907 [Acephala macrosclerotiorum]
MSRKTYFRMPDFDHPPNGLVQLGQIIASPRDPSQRLAPPLPVINTQTNKKTNYHEVVAKARRGEIGLWVQFLASIVGVGGDVTAKWARENNHILEFRELEASFFEPDNEYLQQSVAKSEIVRDHINKTPGKSLYMVTGLKIARGARSIVQMRQAVGLDVKVGADALPFTGVPVQGGPAFKIDNALGARFQFDGSSDFVFAYRLLRIIPKPHGVFKVKRHEKGAEILGNDDQYLEDKDHQDELQPAAMDVEISAVELDSLDYGALPTTLPFEVSSTAVKDDADDTSCMFIVPNTKED